MKSFVWAPLAGYCCPSCVRDGMERACRRRHSHCMETLYNRAEDNSARDLEAQQCLRYAVDIREWECAEILILHGVSISEYVVRTVVFYCNMKCLKLIAARKPLWWSDLGISRLAVSSGSFECLRFVHEAGARLTEEAMNCAVMHNKEAMVRYLFRNGVPLSDKYLNVAGRHYSFECLVFLHEIANLPFSRLMIDAVNDLSRCRPRMSRHVFWIDKYANKPSRYCMCTWRYVTKHLGLVDNVNHTFFAPCPCSRDLRRSILAYILPLPNYITPCFLVGVICA